MTKDKLAPIRDVFAKCGVDLSGDEIWSVQGTPVVYHKAVERLGAALGVNWDAPTIVRAERDEAVLMVIGRMGERMEWSFGEALITDGTRPGNYRVSGRQASYPYAMAEKRAKDRVILKMANLHGYAYSDDEADEFKAGRQIASEPDASVVEYVARAKASIARTVSAQDLRDWWGLEAETRHALGIVKGQPSYTEIFDALTARGQELTSQKDAA